MADFTLLVPCLNQRIFLVQLVAAKTKPPWHSLFAGVVHSFVKTPMFDHPLYQSVLESPDDNDTRLVLADWLEENGDARGEFIRLQIELANRGESTNPSGNDALKQRLVDLERDFRSAWDELLFDQVAMLAKLPWGNAKSLVRQHLYHRGLPSWLGITSADLFQHGDALWQAAPWQYLRVTFDRDELQKLADWQGMRRVRTLTLQLANFSLNATKKFFQSPHFAELESVRFRSYRLEESQIQSTQQALTSALGEGKLQSLKECYVNRTKML